MKKIKKTSIILLALLTIPAIYLLAGEILYVTDDNVILRSGPSTQSGVRARLYRGEQVEVIRVGRRQYIRPWGSHYWYNVRTNNGQVGWIFGGLLSRHYQGQSSSTSSNHRFIINRNNVILRESDSTKSKIIKTLYQSELVTLISKGRSEYIHPWGTHHWHQVQTSDGYTGWVFGAFLTPAR